MKMTTATLSVAMAVGLIWGLGLQGPAARLTAAGATSSPLRITVGAADGVFSDGGGDYVNGVDGVTATYTASTGTIAFANAMPAKGKIGRVINVNLNDPVEAEDPLLGIRPVYLASWMKPIDTADGFYDMRAMTVGDKTHRKWNVQWPGSNNTIDTYHLHWDPPLFPSDTSIELTCTAQGAAGTGPCTEWEASPVGAAGGLRHVWRLSKNVALWQDDGYYYVPFVLAIRLK